MNGPQPQVSPRDRIEIGDTSCVVCQVFEGEHLTWCRVVYLERERAISEQVVCREDRWEFLHHGPEGTYADGDSSLSEYVAMLRRR